MSPSPVQLNQETDRTPPRSILATMPIAPNRSSKEWSASALERDREAEAEAALQQKLEAQLAALQAQIKKTEENKKRSSEQAAIERQKAKDQEFYELSLTQQEKFRGTFADNVFTRVAQTFTKDDVFNYVIAIGEGRSGFEDPTEFKAMLWEAVAGDDPTFIQQAAQQIADRYKKTITDEDILAVRSSVSCFSPRSLSDIWGGPPPPRTLADGTLTSTEQDANIIKFEALERVPEKRNLMDLVEKDATTPVVRSASIANSDITVQLTDPLGNIITGEEEPEAELTADLIEQTPTRVAEPQTPASTRKRLLEDEGTPTPSEAASTSASKKRKTSGGQKSNARTSITKFEEHIASRFESGDLSDLDLKCCVCIGLAKNPRVATKCHHVYCYHCFTTYKMGAKGKDAHEIICGHADCYRTVGAMSKVSEDIIKQLKTTFILKNENQEIRGNNDAEEDLDDVTDMED